MAVNECEQQCSHDVPARVSVLQINPYPTCGVTSSDNKRNCKHEASCMLTSTPFKMQLLLKSEISKQTEFKMCKERNLGLHSKHELERKKQFPAQVEDSRPTMKIARKQINVKHEVDYC